MCWFLRVSIDIKDRNDLQNQVSIDIKRLKRSAEPEEGTISLFITQTLHNEIRVRQLDGQGLPKFQSLKQKIKDNILAIRKERTNRLPLETPTTIIGKDTH